MPAGRRNLKNNWSTTLQADAAAAATTLSLPQAWIDLLTAPNPSSTQWYELTLDDGVQAPEIVRCTGKGTGTVTVVRAQQGTAAPTTWATGTKVEIRITAELARVLEFSGWQNNNLTMGDAAGKSLTTGQYNYLLGQSAGQWLTSGSYNTGLGAFCSVGETGSSNTAVGYEALTGADGAASNLVGVGRKAGQNGGGTSRCVFLGADTWGGQSDVVVIGYGAIVETPNTAVIGSPSSVLTDIYIGGGQWDSGAASADVTLHATGGQGSNIGGADLRLAGGESTGSGAGGKVIVATTSPGASGSARNALTNRAEWDDTGLLYQYGAIKTGDVGATAAQPWRLGTVQAGAVTLDTANYVEVDIGGTVVKLLKAA